MAIKADEHKALRATLKRLLAWEDAHATFDAAVEGLASTLRGVQPQGLPYSAWQILEHLRLTQFDILDFCLNPDYRDRKWPDHYWPETVEPPSAKAWDESVAAYRRDRAALETLAADPKIDVFATIPHGSGQTYLREILLVADHSSYHVGQMVILRRLLGAWTSPSS